MGVVLIAGGASGIGRAALDAFRRQGDTVLLADRDEAGARAAVAADLPGPAEAIVCDLANPDDCDRIVAACVERFGRLDTVFANAGVLLSAPLAEFTAQMWDLSVAVNLRAPFLLARAAAPHLARSDNGSIILTSSTGGLRGHAGMPAYHATKAGLLGLCRSLADELAPHGTRVNCLLPGWIDTPFNAPFWDHQSDPKDAEDRLLATIPMRRQGLPEDVAGAVLFLASPASRYVTGTSLVVDGGYSAV